MKKSPPVEYTGKIYLGMLLHIYQPPMQFREVLQLISRECYVPLLNFINQEPAARFTVNLNWSLTEQLLKNNLEEVVTLLKTALQQKRIEMTGSSAYHAILPLIPHEERIRQIQLNTRRHQKIFGKAFNPQGLFPPEMAVGPELLESLKELNFKWLITDDLPYSLINKRVPYDYIAKSMGTGVFLRSNLWSNKISLDRDEKGKPYSGKQIFKWLEQGLSGWFKHKDGYLILAMDGETFGHHIKGYIEDFLISFVKEIKRHPRFELLHLSEIFERFPLKQKPVPPGSWSTGKEDFWDGNFFPLWKSPRSTPHKILWDLTEMALQGTRKLRDKMDKSLTSCTSWWAAQSPEQLSPMTFRGVEQLLEVIKLASPNDFYRALKLRDELIQEFEKRQKENLLKKSEAQNG